jgi:hypothetical protein
MSTLDRGRDDRELVGMTILDYYSQTSLEHLEGGGSNVPKTLQHPIFGCLRGGLGVEQVTNIQLPGAACPSNCFRRILTTIR